MSDLSEYATLVADTVRMTATPAAERGAKTVDMLALLGKLKGYAANGPLQLAEFGGRVAKLAASLNRPPEPWDAFTAGGPDKGPPAVAFLRPQTQGNAVVDAMWNLAYNWTGPGLLYQLLVEGKVPTNGLTEAIETVMGVFVKTAAAVGSSMAPALVIGAGVLLAAWWWRR